MNEIEKIQVGIYVWWLRKAEAPPTQRGRPQIILPYERAAEQLRMEVDALKNVVYKFTRRNNEYQENKENKMQDAEAPRDEEKKQDPELRSLISGEIYRLRSKHMTVTARTIWQFLKAKDLKTLPKDAQVESQIRWVRRLLAQMNFQFGARHRFHNDIFSDALATEVLDFVKALEDNAAKPIGEQRRLVYTDESFIFHHTTSFNRSWYDPNDHTDNFVVANNTGLK